MSEGHDGPGGGLRPPDSGGRLTTAFGLADNSESQKNAFRNFMSRFPTGVTVVTSYDQQGDPIGLTCSSLCSVTLEPPTLLVCLRSDSATLQAILRRRAFAVNLLHDGARVAAELFASGRATDRFGRVAWRDGPGGPCLTDKVHAVAHCTVRESKRVGDHVIVLAEAADVTMSAPNAPLLYGLRRYESWPSS